MVPEQLPVKYPIKQAMQEDLLKIDIWQLGITLLGFVNPELNALFDSKFDRMTDIPEFTEEFIYYKLSRCWQFAINVRSILFPATDILEPNIRGTLYVLAGESGRSTVIGGCKGLDWKKKEKKQLTIQLGVSQATALETYDRKIATGATQNNNQLPENDGTAVCRFICLKIPEKSLELLPVSDEEKEDTFILTNLSIFSLMTS